MATPAARSAAAWRGRGGQTRRRTRGARREASAAVRAAEARRDDRRSRANADAVLLTSLGLREPDLPLALVAVEGAEVGLGRSRQGRRPRRVHGAPRVVAVVQVPEVADGVDRLAREALAPGFDRRLGDAASRSTRSEEHTSELQSRRDL